MASSNWGNKALAVLMGRHFGTSLVLKGGLKADYLIPIPLHSDKEQKRGYNQSREIARGLSEKTVFLLRMTLF